MQCCRGARAASSPSRRKATEGPHEAPEHLLEVEVLGADLHRSFAKVGVMDPYAVVLVENDEVHRTAPHRWAHRQPQWDASCKVAPADGPGASRKLTVQVWNKNRFHKDVHCGSVTVELPSEIVAQDARELTLEKRGQPTGTLRVTLRPLQRRLQTARSGASLPSLLGASAEELGKAAARDDVGADSIKPPPQEAEEAQAVVDLDEGLVELPVLNERQPIAEAEAKGDAAAAAEPAPAAAAEPDVAPEAEPSPAKAPAADLVGEWTCVDTWGLDEFLKKTGVGILQRQIAAKARWPAWEFAVADGSVRFVNHSAMGVLREQIPLDGTGYAWKDGKGNPYTCQAEWKEADDGGALIIHKRGSLGEYVEERRLSGEGLTFTLKDSASGVTWGRKFRRAA